MTRRLGNRTGKTIARLAVAGAVVAAAPLALAGTANAASDATWDRLAQCESTGNWHINTGNGYHGGLQFSPRTWTAFGGGQYAKYAYQATREQQIAVAEKVLASQGWNAWPSCSRKTGASGAAQPNKAVRLSAPAPAAAPVAKNGADYTVKPGDTLGRIAAANNVPGGWQAVFERNRDVIANPNAISVGQQLDLR